MTHRHKNTIGQFAEITPKQRQALDEIFAEALKAEITEKLAKGPEYVKSVLCDDPKCELCDQLADKVGIKRRFKKK